MKRYSPLPLLLFVLLALAGSGLRTAAARGERPPNVVLIFADDLGTLDLNCYGSRDLHTPNLDALARRGVRFTQFYVNAPVCSPSRAALLTGRDHNRAGVPGNVASEAGKPGMPGSEVTLAEALKGAGYRTALFGKWHLGAVPECEPNAQGFDEFFGHKAGCIDNYSHYFYWSGPHFHDLWRNDRQVREDGTHFSELLVREARRFIGENRDRPFFLYLPFNLPHYPTQAAPEHHRRYTGMAEPRRSYAATITSMDHSVGRILARLDELKLGERTLVLFLSDHGHSTEERTGFGGGNSGPYRGAKFSLLEGGIRVPFVASWPGRLPQGETRGQLALSTDLFPTIAELCGATLPDRKLDGRSLVPVFTSSAAPSPHRVAHWQQGEQWAVREGDWKLLVNGRDTSEKERGLPPLPPLFLANLADDPSEIRNRAAEQPQVVERLTRLHEEWERDLALK